MGYFKEQQLKKINLASDPKYFVEILTDLTWGDIKKFAKINQDGQVDFATSGDLYLQTVIKSWNLDNDAGEVLPITPENLDRLEREDVLLIIQEAGDIATEGEDAKKNSPSK